MGWQKGFDGLHATPLYMRKPEDVEKLIWGPLNVHSLATYLPLFKGKKVEVEALEGELAGQVFRCHLRANLPPLVTGDQVVDADTYARIKAECEQAERELAKTRKAHAQATGGAGSTGSSGSAPVRPQPELAAVSEPAGPKIELF